MSVLNVLVGDEECTFALDDQLLVVPVGTVRLNRTELGNDPPSPEELTNAIGAVLDHLDDVVRELPGAIDAQAVRIAGAEPSAIACVEVGRRVELPFDLSREAAEDVFRTVATERRADRARNPGLPIDLIDSVVAGCCVLVAVMRRLRLDTITVADALEVSVDIGDGGRR